LYIKPMLKIIATIAIAFIVFIGCKEESKDKPTALIEKPAVQVAEDTTIVESSEQLPQNNSCDNDSAVTEASSEPVFVKKTCYSYTLYHKTDDSLQKIYEMTWSVEDGGNDGSDISYRYHYKDSILDYDLISVYNNGSVCSQYIFFDRKTEAAYFTKNYFEEFEVEKQSVNFENRTVILHSYKTAESTADISSLSIIDNSSSHTEVIRDNDFFGKRILEGIFPVNEGKKGETVFLDYSKGK